MTLIMAHKRIQEKNAALTEEQRAQKEEAIKARIASLDKALHGDKEEEKKDLSLKAEKLIELGGKRWTKGGHDRIYFRSWDVIDTSSLSKTKARALCVDDIYFDITADKWVASEQKISLLKEEYR